MHKQQQLMIQCLVMKPHEDRLGDLDKCVIALLQKDFIKRGNEDRRGIVQDPPARFSYGNLNLHVP